MGKEAPSEFGKGPDEHALEKPTAPCALNSLLGYCSADGHSIPGLSRCALHESVRAEVLERSLVFEPAANAPGSVSEEAAFKELLRGRSVGL